MSLEIIQEANNRINAWREFSEQPALCVIPALEENTSGTCWALASMFALCYPIPVRDACRNMLQGQSYGETDDDKQLIVDKWLGLLEFYDGNDTGDVWKGETAVEILNGIQSKEYPEPWTQYCSGNPEGLIAALDLLPNIKYTVNTSNDYAETNLVVEKLQAAVVFQNSKQEASQEDGRQKSTEGHAYCYARCNINKDAFVFYDAQTTSSTGTLAQSYLWKMLRGEAEWSITYKGEPFSLATDMVVLIFEK